jgi:hypothetical protein
MISSIHTITIDNAGNIVLPANLEADFASYMLEMEFEDGELIVRAVLR